MERKLKFHESKLLKKHKNFVGTWKHEDTVRENIILRRYYIQKREDYASYNKLAKSIKKLANGLTKLPPTDPFRTKMTDQLLEKLYSMALIPTKKNLLQAARLDASAFCRRRLAVVLVKNKYCEFLKEAVTFIEQQHVRVGPHVITDPAFLVTRNMEDFVTWTDGAIKKKVLQYNNALDDYDFFG